jgi:hypothetical protein
MILICIKSVFLRQSAKLKCQTESTLRQSVKLKY